jgi:cell division transport system permease protein
MFRRLDLPLDRDATVRILPWVVAVMVYLAVLAAAAALAMNKAILRWEKGLSDEITVQLPWPSLANASTETLMRAEEAAAQVVELLRATAGVKAVRTLDESEVLRLIEPWLGDAASIAELPLPRLIAVEVDAERRPDLNALGRKLGGVFPGAAIDDHQRWLGKLVDLLRTLALVALLVMLLVFATAVALVVLVTRMSLAVHRGIIQLVHLIGAQDSYVARQFQGYVLRLGLKGGLVGTLLAVPTVLLFAHLLSRADAALLPEFSLRPWEWALLAMVPLAITLVATYSARLTALYTLSRMP